MADRPLPPKPPPIREGTPQRAQTSDDRGAAALKNRLASVPPVDSVPVYVCGEATGVLSGEELRSERRKRTPSERVEHVENRIDELENSVTESLGKMTGAFGELAGRVGGLTTVVELAIVGKKADVAVAAHQQQTQADVAAAKQIAEVNEQADRKKARRDRITKLIGAGGGSLALILEALHRFGVL